MSKSSKHFYSIEDAARDFDAESIRFYLQSTHYRSPIEWNEERLREAGIAYSRLTEALATADALSAPTRARREALRRVGLAREGRWVGAERVAAPRRDRRPRGAIRGIARRRLQHRQSPGASLRDRQGDQPRGRQRVGRHHPGFGGRRGPNPSLAWGSDRSLLGWGGRRGNGPGARPSPCAATG